MYIYAIKSICAVCDVAKGVYPLCGETWHHLHPQNPFELTYVST